MNEHRYTLHESLESEGNISTFNEHIRFADGDIYYGKTYTRAFKSRNTFAPIHARRLGTLDEDVFNVKNDSALQLSLGTYDPSIFTPIMLIVASHPDLELKPKASQCVSVSSVVVGEFRITALWCFLYAPTVFSGFFLSARPEGLHDGLSQDKLLEFFEEIKIRSFADRTDSVLTRGNRAGEAALNLFTPMFSRKAELHDRHLRNAMKEAVRRPARNLLDR